MIWDVLVLFIVYMDSGKYDSEQFSPEVVCTRESKIGCEESRKIRWGCYKSYSIRREIKLKLV